MKITLLVVSAAIWSLSTSAYAQDVTGKTLYTADYDYVKRNSDLPGVSIDVVWCAGDEGDTNRQLRAAEVAGSVATFARYSNSALDNGETGQFVRTVRLKQLALEKQTLPQQAVGGNTIVVQGSSDKTSFVADQIKGLIGDDFQIVPSDTDYIGYVQVAICDNVKASERPQYIYFQAATEAQRPFLADAIDALAQQTWNARVYPEPRLARDRSPEISQVRFFHEQDKEFAASLMETVRVRFGLNSSLRSFPALATNENRGAIEVWLGRDFVPPVTSKRLICIGDTFGRCIDGAEVTLACGSNADDWANRNHCPAHFAKKISDRAGGRCGFETWEISCFTSKKP